MFVYKLFCEIKYAKKDFICFLTGFPGTPSREGIILSKMRVSRRDPNLRSLSPGSYLFAVLNYTHVDQMLSESCLAVL